MRSNFFILAIVIGLSPALFAQSQGPGSDTLPPHAQTPEPQEVPPGVILVKGAWSSASDSVTPLPEGGNIADNIYANGYFGLSYPVPSDWREKYKGPPPSDSGYYVLTQLSPADTFKGPATTIAGCLSPR
jgi:hypothetical protein